jgi:hypothetical protein
MRGLQSNRSNNWRNIRVSEVLKLQKGGLYLEIVIDDKALEHIQFTIAFLDFLALKFKNTKEEKP